MSSNLSATNTFQEEIVVHVEAGGYAHKGDGDVPNCMEDGGPARCVELAVYIDLDARVTKVDLFCKEAAQTSWTSCKEGAHTSKPVAFGYFSAVNNNSDAMFRKVSTIFRNWRDDGARDAKMIVHWEK